MVVMGSSVMRWHACERVGVQFSLQMVVSEHESVRFWFKPGGLKFPGGDL